MNDNQIGRRKFIQYSAEGVALAASGGSVMAAEHITMNQEADKVGLNIMSDIDVLVVGGGTAGTIAAIQACKSRCKNTSGGTGWHPTWWDYYNRRYSLPGDFLCLGKTNNFRYWLGIGC